MLTRQLNIEETFEYGIFNELIDQDYREVVPPRHHWLFRSPIHVDNSITYSRNQRELMARHRKSNKPIEVEQWGPVRLVIRKRAIYKFPFEDFK